MAVERFLNEDAWARLMELIDELGGVDLDSLTARMDAIEASMVTVTNTANSASQSAQAATAAVAQSNTRISSLETLTESQGSNITALQAVSDSHTTQIGALNIQSVRGATKLETGDDMNDCQPGFYYQAGNNHGVLNAPSASGFTLITFKKDTVRTQFVITNASEAYYRTEYISSGWQAWRKITATT